MIFRLKAYIYSVILGALLLLISGGLSTAFAKDKPLRTVKVKIVADEGFAKQQEWQRRAMARLIDISDELSRVLQVTWEPVGFEIWAHEPSDDLYKLASRMVVEVSPDSADVIIGFTWADCPQNDNKIHTDGVTVPFRGILLQTYTDRCPRSIYQPFVFIHEWVHLFGGVHVPEPSLMTPLMSDTVRAELDDLNQRIVRLTRTIDFEQGYASLNRESLEKLIGLYTRAVQGGNEEALTFFELGRMYMAIGENDAAMLVFNRAVMDDPSFTTAWLYLAECYHVQGLIGQAIGILNNAAKKADSPGPIHHRLMELYLIAGDSTAAYREGLRAQKSGIAVDSILLQELQK